MEEQAADQMGHNNSYKPHSFIFYALTTSILCFLLLAAPALTLLLTIAWGILVVLAGLYFKPVYIWLMALLNGFSLMLYVALVHRTYGTILILQEGAAALIAFGCFFGLAIYTMGFLAARGNGYYKIRTWGIAAVLVGVSMYLGWAYFTEGSIGIREMETELNLRFEEAINTYESTGMLEMYAKQGISKQDLQLTFKNLSRTVARHLPASYYLQGIVAVFFILLTTSFLSLRRKIDRLIRKPYLNEAMPWVLAWVVIAGLAFCLWGYDQKDVYYYIGSNILVVMAPITCYYGLAAVIYKLGEMNPNSRRWLMVILIVLSAVFLPSAVIFLSLFGLFDSLLDFRKLRSRREESE
ncbi:MAG: DUF2232 domain-containing protein [Syntrophomonas sp.]